MLTKLLTNFFFNRADSGKWLAPHTTSIKFSDLIEKSKNYFFWHRLCLASGRHFSFVSLLRIVWNHKSLWLVNRGDSKWTSAPFVRCSRTGLPCPAPRMYPRVNFFWEWEILRWNCGSDWFTQEIEKKPTISATPPLPPPFPTLPLFLAFWLGIKHHLFTQVWAMFEVHFVWPLLHFKHKNMHLRDSCLQRKFLSAPPT